MQHKAGLLAPAAYESYVAGARHYLAKPGLRAAWKLSRGQFGDEFQAFSDAIVKEMEGMPPGADASMPNGSGSSNRRRTPPSLERGSR